MQLAMFGGILRSLSIRMSDQLGVSDSAGGRGDLAISRLRTVECVSIEPARDYLRPLLRVSFETYIRAT